MAAQSAAHRRRPGPITHAACIPPASAADALAAVIVSLNYLHTVLCNLILLSVSIPTPSLSLSPSLFLSFLGVFLLSSVSHISHKSHHSARRFSFFLVFFFLLSDGDILGQARLWGISTRPFFVDRFFFFFFLFLFSLSFLFLFPFLPYSYSNTGHEYSLVDYITCRRGLLTLLSFFPSFFFIANLLSPPPF